MAPNSLLLAACLLACCASLTLAGDRILPTVSPACKDQFNTIIKEQYAGDAECADLIKKAMNTAPTTAADCPGGKEAAAGSAVQKCMSKNEVGREACRQQWQQSQQSAGGGGRGRWSLLQQQAGSNTGSADSAMHAKHTPERCMLRLCLQKAKAAWTTFIKGCEILNVNEVSCPVLLDPELLVWQPDLLQHHQQQPSSTLLALPDMHEPSLVVGTLLMPPLCVWCCCCCCSARVLARLRLLPTPSRRASPASTV